MKELENHMVLNSKDAPWNREDMPEWECGCGYDHAYDVKKVGYPQWHAKGNFMEECAACRTRCCKDCAITCRICGQRYCPSCHEGFFKPLSLCENCATGYVDSYDPDDTELQEKLISIERKVCAAAGRYHAYEPSTSELAWLIDQVKEGWQR